MTVRVTIPLVLSVALIFLRMRAVQAQLSESFDCLAGDCNSTVCAAPACQCLAFETPLRTNDTLDIEETPQMVLLTFMKTFTEEERDVIRSLLPRKQRNPNGASVTATLYVTNTSTDYCAVRHLWERGHEVAAHARDYGQGQWVWVQYNYSVWEYEMVGQREYMAQQLDIPLREIRGMRAPHLAVTGNTPFTMMAENGFQYDSSLIHAGPIAWPFTLDYKPWHDISQMWPRPDQCFPGLWEVPVRYLVGTDECAHYLTCDTLEQTLEILNNTYMSHRTGSRAPFVLNLDAPSLILRPNLTEAIRRLLDYIFDDESVYMVSTWQALQWMQNPTPLSELRDFTPWRVPRRESRDCKVASELEDEAARRRGGKKGGGGGGGGDGDEPFLSGSTLLIIEVVLLMITALLLINRDSQ